MTLADSSKKLSYADYLKLPEGTTIQVIDGVPYNMSPAPSTSHQKISMNLSHLFTNFFKEENCEVFAAPFDVRLFADHKRDEDITNIVQPDISVICDKGKLDEKGCTGSPDLIVEILSPYSARLDKIIKRNLYENAEVKEYWIADPQNALLELYQLDSQGNYGKPYVFSGSDCVEVSFFKDFTINVSDVFPDFSFPNKVKEGKMDYYNLLREIESLSMEEKRQFLADLKKTYFDGSPEN